MSAQTTYGFIAPIGTAGGIVDVSPYAIDTFLNEEADGKMGFGLGVVHGTAQGKQVKLPVTASTAAVFAGVTVNNRTTECDWDGNVRVRNNASVGVMRYGRVFVRIVDGITPKYGDPVYLIKDGDNAGCFTNATASNAVQIKAQFAGAPDAALRICAIDLFNQAQA